MGDKGKEDRTRTRASGQKLRQEASFEGQKTLFFHKGDQALAHSGVSHRLLREIVVSILDDIQKPFGCVLWQCVLGGLA